jgi:hypothetical protein
MGTHVFVVRKSFEIGAGGHDHDLSIQDPTLSAPRRSWAPSHSLGTKIMGRATEMPRHRGAEWRTVRRCRGLTNLIGGPRSYIP